MDRIKVLIKHKIELSERMCEEIDSTQLLPQAEKERRKQTIKNGISVNNNQLIFSEKMLSECHEFCCLKFFEQIGKVEVADDSRHIEGVDIILNVDDEICNVECVMCTYGEIEETEQFDKSGIKSNNDQGVLFRSGNVNQFLNVIGPRITGALREKLGKIKKYNKDIKVDKKIHFCDNAPNIIFVNAGQLRNDVFLDNGPLDIMSSILYGKGTLILNLKNKELFYDAISTIEKVTTNSIIPVNIFGTAEYNMISGVVFTTGTLSEKYDKNNTKLYVNPNACVPISRAMYEKMLKIMNN